MERKVVVYIAVSIDGYIATREDTLAWLTETPGDGDNGYSEFIATVDTVVMGRRTYDWILAEEGRDHFPYQKQTCYVFSGSATGGDGLVTYVNEDVSGFIRRLQQHNGKNIWLVGGGSLLHGFIEAQLIDEWIITIAPTVLGDGIPLFLKHSFETRLELTGMRRFGQFAELHYKTQRKVLAETETHGC